MALVPHKITALAESDADGTDGKNIIAGAVVSLFDSSGAAVTLFDDESGNNGSTTKQTDSSGQVVVWVTPGEYSESVNGSTQRAVTIGGRTVTSYPNTESLQNSRPTQTGQRAENRERGYAQYELAEIGYTALTGDVVAANGRVWALHIEDRILSEYFGAKGDGTTDDYQAITDALSRQKYSGGYVHLLDKIYATSQEIVIDNGNRLIGMGGNWKRRTGYTYEQAKYSEIKYVGSVSADTCALRVSRKPVGEAATSVTPPNGDDLVNFEVRDLNVNANNIASFGLYMYRCGNNDRVSGLTAQNAKVRNILILGVYAAKWGHFGSYECESHGVSVGDDSIYNWGSVESTCFDLKASFHTANNGTNGAYVKGSGTDLEESGGIFVAGRGSVIEITSESNNGRACILKQRPVTGGSAGSTDFNLPYIEANGDGAYIEYGNNNDGIRVNGGFIHPGNGTTLEPQDFKLAATSGENGGPTDNREWISFNGLMGNLSGVGFAINSNTFKYKVNNCDAGVTYPDKKHMSQGTFATAFFKADNGLTDTRYVRGASLSRVGTGQYRLTFNTEEVNTEYSVSVEFLGNSTDKFVSLNTKSTTIISINTYDSGGLSDTGLFLDVLVTRKDVNTND